jgi:UDP-glucose 4-epimerase
MVIPNFVQQALRGEAIRVFGDGEQSRCFTHVQDAVRAAVGLMETTRAEGQVFNVGTEEEISMNELARRVCGFTGSSAGFRHVPYAEVYGPGFEDMRRRTPDIQKLRRTIGYEPQHTTDDILRAVIDYYRSREARPAPALSNA